MSILFGSIKNIIKRDDGFAIFMLPKNSLSEPFQFAVGKAAIGADILHDAKAGEQIRVVTDRAEKVKEFTIGKNTVTL